MFLEFLELGDEVNDLSAEWLEEIDQRWQSFEKGEINAIDSEEADQKLMTDYGIKI